MSKPLIISADQIKEYFPKYDPSKSSTVHSDSAKIADKRYTAAIKCIDTEIILLWWWAASGKTEYLSAYIQYSDIQEWIYLDGTLPSLKWAKIKIDQALRSWRQISIHYVMPDSLHRAFTWFLHRSRKYTPKHFYKTHSDSRAALLDIAKEYPDIEILVIESRYDDHDWWYYIPLKFDDREWLITYLESIQYTSKQIKNFLDNKIMQHD